MLVELAVTNLGVIESARIPFSPGMVALTGETGAGKTMLIEAINLLMGDKPDPSRVREGASEAVVEGLFAVGEDEFVLRRVVPSSGRSRAYINGQLATAAALGELGATLIELHGQHAQQALLQPRAQREALDHFAGVDTTALDAARRAVRDCSRRLDEMGGDERSRAREIDLLKFQLDEIDAVGLVAGEEAALETEEDLLADALSHREAANSSVSLLGDDGAAADLIARAVASLEQRRPYLGSAARLRDIAAELSDCIQEIRGIGESIEPDEDRLEAVRSRRQKLIELRRKYGDSVEDVVQYATEARERLEELTAHDATRVRLAAELATAQAEVAQCSARVGKQRRKGAESLGREIESRLRILAMPNARLEVVVEDTPELPGAGQAVEFQIAANPGTAIGPLNKVASGGELSRVMLALRLVLSDAPPTIVFDEVDAGIGGETALAVGRALAQLGSESQVLVVTHLPQVAAFADVQILVSKASEANSATTTAMSLSDGERVIELSRMLSGSPESATAREHASELLSHARDSLDRVSR
ncbi:MAG TPA: DNA repair protein RecN [Microthrixaceae bacterium]|nr:DNA repair protein RecN [Microthrixaceae bacterium]